MAWRWEPSLEVRASDGCRRRVLLVHRSPARGSLVVCCAGASRFTFTAQEPEQQLFADVQNLNAFTGQQLVTLHSVLLPLLLMAPLFSVSSVASVFCRSVSRLSTRSGSRVRRCPAGVLRQHSSAVPEAEGPRRALRAKPCLTHHTAPVSVSLAVNLSRSSRLCSCSCGRWAPTPTRRWPPSPRTTA